MMYKADINIIIDTPSIMTLLPKCYVILAVTLFFLADNRFWKY